MPEADIIWKPIVGYEGVYEVSDHRRVRRVDGNPYAKDGVLNEHLDKDGYRSVGLKVDGKSRTHHVHILVAFAFIGPRPDGLQCAHVDGDKSNCKPTNLAWVTCSVNNLQKRDHGTATCGEKHPQAVLTADDVDRILGLKRLGLGKRRVARQLSLAVGAVAHVLAGRTWKHA